MKIAVTYDNGLIFQHFGQTKVFKVYDIADSAVQSSSVMDTSGKGHGALAGLLKQWEIDTLICGGIGGPAKQSVSEAGIQLYAGVSGSADKAVADLLANKLVYNPDEECDHHGEHHHH